MDECQERDLTYSVPLKATLRLRIREDTEEGRKDKSIIEQEVYLGELPIITDKGTFIINGAERVIVSQLHRSPGVFFDESIHPSGKKLYTARIIPYRGSWVEFSLDVNDIMYVHIDRKRKLPVTVLLKALGLRLRPRDPRASSTRPRRRRSAARAPRRSRTRSAGSPRRTSSTRRRARCCSRRTRSSRWSGSRGCGRRASRPSGRSCIPHSDEADIVRNTLKKDSTKTEDEALTRIYNLLRPGEPPRADTARDILKKLFFNPKRYDLAKVGRYKLNRKLPHEILLGGKERRKQLALEVPDDNQTTLGPEDFLVIIAYLMHLRLGGEVPGVVVTTDDIDHLGNRRVRAVGELLANQFNVGLARMARIIRERMTLQDAEQVTPYDLINARTISAVIQSFFGSSQLSQFMDQTNPLAELTHKRRLSALGPGGLTRDRAGFEVRDVHYTHYGRMCPIETPEGPNIGLISSLATYARVNELGFLETPYRRVESGTVDKKQVQFLSADVEDQFKIAQANASVGPRRRSSRASQNVRERGEFPMVEPSNVDFMDISPIQLVSPAAALIPFLEHDDANRALMGSNMQRQAVPLLYHRGAARRHRARGEGGGGFRRAGHRQARRRRWSRVAGDSILVRYDQPEGKAHDGRLLRDGGDRHVPPDQVPPLATRTRASTSARS